MLHIVILLRRKRIHVYNSNRVQWTDRQNFLHRRLKIVFASKSVTMDIGRPSFGIERRGFLRSNAKRGCRQSWLRMQESLNNFKSFENTSWWVLPIIVNKFILK